MEGILNFIRSQIKQRIVFISLLISVFLLWIDYITGRFIQFPIIYVLPTGITAWYGKKFTAYTLAILLPLTRIAFHFQWHELQALPIAITNAFISLTALLFYIYLITKIALHKRKLEKEVNILEGMLPICASCKKIQNKDGSWEQIESYIHKHSEADFSHSICPDCMKKLYPEFIKDEENKSKQ